jgi:hypothetical protein
VPDWFKRKPRNAVHVGRQDDAVPVDRRALVERVAHAQGDAVALAPAQQRRRQLAIDHDRRARGASEVDRQRADLEFVRSTRQHARARALREDRCAGETQSCGETAEGDALHEAST